MMIKTKGLGAYLGALLGMALAVVLAVAAAPAGAEELRLQNEGRPAYGGGWGEPVAWDKYQAVRVNVGESPGQERAAFFFDYRGDSLTIDFRNEDFKTADGALQGNIADPRPVEDPQATLSWARSNLYYWYRLQVPGQQAPAGVVLTPYTVRASRSGGTIVVKLTDEAISERDIADAY